MSASINLSLSCSYATAVEPSQRVCELASMFGLGVDETKTIEVVPPLNLALAPGRVVFITGASGGGKSTLLRLIRNELAARDEVNVIDFAALAPTDSALPLIESVAPTLEQAAERLALAGLNDAFVMLRRPAELSDGQRYRLRLALAIGASSSSEAWPIVLADEFGSTLDRLTAQVIARNIRKWTTRRGVTFIAATAHDDLLESLDPDTLIIQRVGGQIDIREKENRS